MGTGAPSATVLESPALAQCVRKTQGAAGRARATSRAKGGSSTATLVKEVPTMRRILWAAGLAILAAVAAAGPVRADPLSLDSPVSLTGQRFEWQSGYASRPSGTYGQWEVSLSSGVAYEFFTADAVGGTSDDTYLYVLNGAGSTVLAYDDDSAAGYNAGITFTPGTTGTYLVRLRAYARGTYGTCTLNLRKRASSVPEGGVTLSPGDELEGQEFRWISSYSQPWAGTYGQYTSSLEGGTIYVFETSDASGGGADTYLYLLNSNGRVVASDDDSGAGYQSRLAFRPSEDGTYYLRLRAYDRGARGTCTLSLTAVDEAPGEPELPDLLTWDEAMEDAYIAGSGSSREIRFTNAVANRGAGPLDVYGVVDSDGTTQAYQAVENEDGSRTVYQVGTFVFQGHESHNHWHFDEFATYRLVNPSTGATVATSGKVSFCLEDSERYTDEYLPGSPSSPVYSCSRQGISRGWADVYDASLAGQSIPLAGVADGTYDLVSTADPEGRLLESDSSNNTATVRVRISGSSVTIVR